MKDLKCPGCGSLNLRQNSERIKAESGDWGICSDCYRPVRLEETVKETDEIAENEDTARG